MLEGVKRHLVATTQFQQLDAELKEMKREKEILTASVTDNNMVLNSTGKTLE